eukprot:3310381-Prymnesium_polylepis.1
MSLLLYTFTALVSANRLYTQLDADNTYTLICTAQTQTQTQTRTTLSSTLTTRTPSSAQPAAPPAACPLALLFCAHCRVFCAHCRASCAHCRASCALDPSSRTRNGSRAANAAVLHVPPC